MFGCLSFILARFTILFGYFRSKNLATLIVTGYMLLGTSQYDVIFTLASQRFGEGC